MGEYPIINGFSYIAQIGHPPVIGSTLFVGGCNLRCPMCINREAVLHPKSKPVIDVEEAIAQFLLREEQVIAISGGEPLADPRTLNLLKRLQNCRFATAIATNGFFPERLKEAIERKLVNIVQMDIKAIPTVEKYSAVAGVSLTQEDLDRMMESVIYLRDVCESKTARSFRTTVCTKYVQKEDLFEIARIVGKNCIYVLQPFETHQTLSADLACEEYCVPFETLEQWSLDISPLVRACVVRDV